MIKTVLAPGAPWPTVPPKRIVITESQALESIRKHPGITAEALAKLHGIKPDTVRRKLMRMRHRLEWLKMPPQGGYGGGHYFTYYVKGDV